LAAVRIARRPAAAAELPRRTELLVRLAGAGLPFAVPVPLSEVVSVDGRTAVALSWVDGRPAEKGAGRPGVIRRLLATLAEVPMAMLDGVLGPPHCYCGGPRWAEVIATEVIPRLPARWRDDVKRRTEDALALPDVVPSLVHGDLGGENVHYDGHGSVVGVLDWDLAQPFDPAVDAACLAWHGWDTVRAAVDEKTFGRARIWGWTFGYEQLGAAVLNGEPPEIIDRYLAGTIAWLERTEGCL
jgi:aminoglycoside phosphotransferase (APT) family kinase protein